MKHQTAEEIPKVKAEKDDNTTMGAGKCMASGCSCPSYVEPPGGFDCKRCGHARSEHW